MPIPEVSHQWTLTSTGAAVCIGPGSTNDALNHDLLRNCQNITVVAYTPGGASASTAAIGLEVGVHSTSPFARYGSTANTLSSNGDAVVFQLPGPIRAIRPYLIDRDASTTIVYVTLDGN